MPLVIVSVLAGGSAVARGSLIVSDISTSTATAPALSEPGRPGTGNSGFLPSGSYSVQYDGQTEILTGLIAGDQNFRPLAGAVGRVELRRSPGSGNDALVIWQLGSAAQGTGALALGGTPVQDLGTLFSVASLSQGIDNVFANTTDYNDNVANIERIDIIFDAGLRVTTSLAFGIFDRGLDGMHDGFRMAGITELNQGLPSNYGQIHTFDAGSWGTVAVAAPTDTAVLRRSDPADPFRPTVVLEQGVGGAIVQASTLAPLEATIYGYSLFAPDVQGSGLDLVDWSNASIFLPTTTGLTADRLGGGLDLASASATAFSSSVPEPTSTVLIAGAAGAALMRRRRMLRNQA